MTVGFPVTSHNVGTRCTAELRDLAGIESSSNFDIGDLEVSGGADAEEGIPFVSIGDATDVTATVAALHDELTDLGGANSAECYVEYREVATGSQTLEEPGEFRVSLDDLTSRRYYEYCAVIEMSDSDVAVDSSETVGTPGRSNGQTDRNGPRSASHVDPADGFTDPAPWLGDDTPVIEVSEPTRRQLSAAVGVDGPCLVVFESSGTIDLEKQRLMMANDKLYLAGQTAPPYRGSRSFGAISGSTRAIA